MNSIKQYIQPFIQDTLLAAVVLYFSLLVIDPLLDGYAQVLFPLTELGYVILAGVLVLGLLYRRQP